MNVLALLLAGLLAGTIGGLLGLGGGILLMPVLRFALGLPPALAAGTCIVGVFCTTLAGSYQHHKLGHIQFPSLMPVIVSGVIATVLCSLLFSVVAEKGGWLDLGIGLVFLCVAVRMTWAALRRRQGRQPFLPSASRLEGKLVHKVAIGTLAGSLPGLFGIGTGAILVPAFTMVLGAQIKVAIGSSLACFMTSAFVSMVFKLSQGFVDLGLAVPIGLGAVLGSNLGSRLNKRFPAEWLKAVFGLVFLYVALKFILSSRGISI